MEAHDVRGAFSRDKRQRHQIDRRGAVDEVDVHDDNRGRRAVGARQPRQGEAVGHRQSSHTPGLVPEPALLGQEGREVVLEQLPVLEIEHVKPVVRDLHATMRALGFFTVFEGEPVKAVRTEGEEVGQVADGGKLRRSEQLDRNEVAELREV